MIHADDSAAPFAAAIRAAGPVNGHHADPTVADFVIPRVSLDALFMHLYGPDADDAPCTRDTFPIVREHDPMRSRHYRTNDDVLAWLRHFE